MSGYHPIRPPQLRSIRIPSNIFYGLDILTILWILVISPSPCFSYDRPFNQGANWGGTGLMEIPNARILEDGEIRIGITQALPYRWFTADMGILPGLEFGLRLTQITNIESGLYFGNLDRAFDLKYQLLPESKKWPAIAIGVNDFYGTRLFPSEYLTMSRQLYPLDFTIGIGSKRLRGDLNIPWLENYGFFGGVEWVVHERVKLLAEYNPVDYKNDKPSARGVPEGAKLPINIGLRATIIRGIHLGLSYQRGNTLGMQIQVQSLLGERMLPQNPDPPHRVDIDRRPFKERDQQDMLEKIHGAIRDSGFSKVSVYTDGKDLIAEFENQKYLSNQKAAGRILRILLYYSPSDCRELSVIIKKRDMPIIQVSVRAEYFEKFLLKKIPEDLFYKKLLKVQLSSKNIEEDKQYLVSNPDPVKRFSFNIEPDLATYLFDLSNYLQVRAGVRASVDSQLWSGGQITSRYILPLFSNVEATFAPAPEAVRSDVDAYLTSSFTLDNIIADQTFRFNERLFGRISLGYLEKMYAGMGAECLYLIGDGRFALGIDGDYVIKREPERLFNLLNFKRNTIFLTGYYSYTPLDITVETKYGRFLAGDIGWKFDVSRRYSTGATIGFFYTVTNTDEVKGYFNKGYHHKGVYIEIPARMFMKKDSTEMYEQRISPWTRDVGATVYDGVKLFKQVKDLLPSRFIENVDKLRE